MTRTSHGIGRSRAKSSTTRPWWLHNWSHTSRSLNDIASGKKVTVGECTNAFQFNRKVLEKVSPRTLERDRHKINLITSYLGGGGGRVIDLDSAITEKTYLKIVENRGISRDGMHNVHLRLSQIMRNAYLGG